jgi:hypothetical protein
METNSTPASEAAVEVVVEAAAAAAEVAEATPLPTTEMTTPAVASAAEESNKVDEESKPEEAAAAPAEPAVAATNGEAAATEGNVPEEEKFADADDSESAAAAPAPAPAALEETTKAVDVDVDVDTMEVDAVQEEEEAKPQETIPTQEADVKMETAPEETAPEETAPAEAISTVAKPADTATATTTTATTEESLPAVWEPHDADVLSGRGASVNAHGGNKKFRALCFCRKPEFDAGNHAAKRRIATEIVAATSNHGSARFLKKKIDKGPWHEMTTEQAILKACQVMRDYKRPDRLAIREMMQQNGSARKRTRQQESTPMLDTVRYVTLRYVIGTLSFSQSIPSDLTHYSVVGPLLYLLPYTYSPSPLDRWSPLLKIPLGFTTTIFCPGEVPLSMAISGTHVSERLRWNANSNLTLAITRKNAHWRRKWFKSFAPSTRLDAF